MTPPRDLVRHICPGCGLVYFDKSDGYIVLDPQENDVITDSEDPEYCNNCLDEFE